MRYYVLSGFPLALRQAQDWRGNDARYDTRGVLFQMIATAYTSTVLIYGVGSGRAGTRPSTRQRPEVEQSTLQGKAFIGRGELRPYIH